MYMYLTVHFQLLLLSWVPVHGAGAKLTQGTPAWLRNTTDLRVGVGGGDRYTCGHLEVWDSVLHACSSCLQRRPECQGKYQLN